MTSIRNLDEQSKRVLADECMERIEFHFGGDEHLPMYMPRAQYEELRPYLRGFFLVDWDSPFDEVSDLPPMITITDWMADGS